MSQPSTSPQTSAEASRPTSSGVQYSCCDGTWATGHAFSCPQGGFLATRTEGEGDER